MKEFEKGLNKQSNDKFDIRDTLFRVIVAVIICSIVMYIGIRITK